MTEYVSEFENQIIDSDESKKMLKDSMQTWLQVFKFPSVEPTTYDRSECSAKNQIYPLLGEKAVGDITSADIINLLNYVFIGLLDMGIGGAAIATGLGYSVTAVVGLVVSGNKQSLLHFTRPAFRLRVLASAATNGCSEMATTLVMGIITMMINGAMLYYVGEDGVAAVTIITYILVFASSLYTG